MAMPQKPWLNYVNEGYNSSTIKSVGWKLFSINAIVMSGNNFSFNCPWDDNLTENYFINLFKIT